MRAAVRLAIASLLGLSLAGCTDRDQLLAPRPRIDSANAAVVPPPNPGDPSLPPRIPPTKRPSLADQFSVITSGGDFTCAQRYDQQVYCWGADDAGQVGRAPSSVGCLNNAGMSFPCVYEPTRLMYNGAPLLLRQVDAGARHACGLDAGGNAYCWGDGNLGEVGAANGGTAVFTAPMPVIGGRTFGWISAGSRSTCATSSTGDAIYCWGKFHGSTAGPTVLVQDSRYRWSTLAVGEVHVCGIDINGVNGTLRCSGQNIDGQSGVSDRTVKATFDMGTTFPGWVTAVSTNSYTTCVDQNLNATVQCVGQNGYGQLGNGQTGYGTSTGDAQTVGRNLVLRGVAMSDSHGCALANDDTAYCWGVNNNGQLGNGTLVNSNTPQPVSGGRTYRSIAVGTSHTCAVGTDNIIYCWGRNDRGQLGNYWVPDPKIPTATAALVQ